MSQYLCPECGSDSMVLDTRPSYTRLRRRRRCNHPEQSHKFTTVEVPVDAPQRIVELFAFIFQNASNFDEDMLAYAQSSSRDILLGLNEEEP